MKLKFNKFKKVNMKNLIGIDKNKAKKLTEILNKLLADYEIFYQNLRGFHWNIKGREFFELHVKFEELYNDAFIKIDEIAERILTLEGIPMHTYTDYLKTSSIKEENNITNGVDGVKIIVKNFASIITTEREILELASEANDEGTVSLMSDYITQTEKTLWMLNSYLS
jgi:starvation-inducible DNA-binding protein